MYTRAGRYSKRAIAAGMITVLCGYTLLACVPATPGAHRRDNTASLDRRMERFLASFDSISAQDFAEFFPRTGEVVYRHTSHTPEGDSVTVRRFVAADIPAALQYSGPLYASFVFQFEGQPMGLLTHQVMVRKGKWRRVGESRFVPPDADPASPAFVEWRLEGNNWGDLRDRGRNVRRCTPTPVGAGLLSVRRPERVGARGQLTLVDKPATPLPLRTRARARCS